MFMASVIKLCKADNEFSIVDNDGNIIVRDIQNVDEYNACDDRFIGFRTINNEFSCISLSGLFFGKFSFRKYDMVYELVPGAVLKVRKGNKYGTIDCGGEELISCIFDEIEFLYSNIFVNRDIIKLRRNNKFSLAHCGCINNHCKEYDYIYTPIQPLNKFIVYLNGKYGFIDATTLKEIIEPAFKSVEELCDQYKCNVDKYIKDLYQTNVKLDFKSIADSKLCYSYIIDAHKVLKGKWGGNSNLISDSRTGEDYLYSVYYSPMNKQVPINMYGYFYNLFDCRIYNVVVHAIDNLYIAVKDDEKYGLIDDEFNEVLDFFYKDIRLVHLKELEAKPLFIITYRDKQFLYNAETKLRSCMYDSLSCYDIKAGFYKNYLVYEENGRYGLLSPEGHVLTKARFDLSKSKGTYEPAHANFREIFHNREYRFYIDNNKYYGKVPLDKYDSCIQKKIDSCFCYYIVRVDGKYGLLNDQCKEIDMPKFDDIIFVKDAKHSIFGGMYLCDNPFSETFLIGYVNEKYYLYSIQSLKSHSATLIIGDCDEMEMIEERVDIICKYEYPYVRFKKNGSEGYVNEDGEIISTDFFDEIIPFKDAGYYLVYKNGKVGLLNSRRKTLLPCVYDEIVDIAWRCIIVIENGVKKEIEFQTHHADNSSYNEKESCHYSRYSGSYAQDEMGYSDEDIDTIFDGDPDAYWNID